MRLTLDPELIDPAVDLDGLQGHAEGRQCDDRHEEDLARVALQEVAQLAQLILEPRPDPNGRALSVGLALRTRATEAALEPTPESFSNQLAPAAG